MTRRFAVLRRGVKNPCCDNWNFGCIRLARPKPPEPQNTACLLAGNTPEPIKSQHSVVSLVTSSGRILHSLYCKTIFFQHNAHSTQPGYVNLNDLVFYHNYAAKIEEKSGYAHTGHHWSNRTRPTVKHAQCWDCAKLRSRDRCLVTPQLFAHFTLVKREAVTQCEDAMLE